MSKPVLIPDGVTRYVDIRDLKIDPSYQRQVKRKHRVIIKNLRPRSLTVIIVGQRDDGSLWIIDGQQRWTAVKAKYEAGEIKSPMMLAFIVHSTGPQFEAQMFEDINGPEARTAVTPREHFRTMLTAGNEAALEVNQAVESVGFKIVLGGRDSDNDKRGALQLTCVNTLLEARRKYGVDAIPPALLAIKTAWPEDPDGAHSKIIGGLTRFIGLMKQAGTPVDQHRLVARLALSVPVAIQQKASAQSTAGPLEESCAKVIEELYGRKVGAARFRKAKAA